MIKLILLNEGFEADETAAHLQQRGRELQQDGQFRQCPSTNRSKLPSLLATKVLNAAGIRGYVVKPQFFDEAIKDLNLLLNGVDQ